MTDQSTEPTRIRTRPAASPQPRPIRGRGAIFSAFACAAALMFVSLIVLWLGQTSSRVYQEGAEALTIRATLRADTDDVAAENLAADIRRQVPDVSIEVINEAMGRSLLALQEPWIALMPDFEVTPLPILLEMNHPQLLTNPEEIATFVENLEKNSAVDFVAYNETAHNRLVKFATASAQIEKHALHWLLSALALAGFAAVFACSRMAGNLSLLGETLSALTVWAPSWALAWLTYRQWETTALTSGDWQRLDIRSHLTIGIAALLIIAAAKVVSITVSRLRQ